MLGLGFGFVEVGTITPRPQQGNPKPRLFRLAEDRAVINRMGFNNRGQPSAFDRLQHCSHIHGVIGVNVGVNKDSADRIADYVAGVRSMSAVARYITVNVSSPNTPGLRQLQDEGALRALLSAIDEARERTGPPIFLKVAPDLGEASRTRSSVSQCNINWRRSSFRTRRCRGRRSGPDTRASRVGCRASL